ncbi:mitochondrial carrier domain-containing protein [Mucor mucedo]|uniref:mitochondrial carrier domain-containing protein n=1 Tax=Mucor mucedo TaxID=29922 RepID=UPI002220557A|nr:mitochondrial carrier domain-containing protein [Mucor mucedo]KAI7892200.1 mitochondrial carrier domain-containing protein [Mucor mucedo]
MSTNIDGYSLFASSTAGLVTRVMTHPLDTIKIRLQSSTTGSNNLSGLQKVIFPTGGQNLGGLYRGLPVALIFSVPALTVYLTSYEAAKGLLHDHGIARDAVMSHLTSACLAEVAACLLFTPMEVLKNRLQTYKGQMGNQKLIGTIFRQEGIRGFYKGYGMGLAVFVPHSMVYFVTYEKMKGWWMSKDEKNHAWWLYMICSGVAGVTAISISTPLDIIKTRWQISAAENGQAFRSGPWHIAKQIFLHEGKTTLLRSFGATVAWGLPTTAISMTVFEMLKDNRHAFS